MPPEDSLILRKPSPDIEAMDDNLVSIASPNPATAQVFTGPILYHGGDIMLGTNYVYFIWYGWGANKPQGLLQTLITGLNQSQYYNINTAYYNGSGTHISNSIAYGGSLDVPISSFYGGNNLSDTGVYNLVVAGLNYFGANLNGIYVVISANGVAENSGFCNSYCAFHSDAVFYGGEFANDIAFGYIGDGDMCPTKCQLGATKQGIFEVNSPTGDPTGDNIANWLAHELSEAVTDPYGNAWYDANGREDADKCVGTYGPVIGGSLGNNNRYDVILGGTPYMLQELWIPANAGCGIRY
jgi:hypothetical protein